MRRTVLSALLAIAPALAFGVDDPKQAASAASRTEQQQTTPRSEKAQEAAKSASPASKPAAANPAAATEGPADPLKMAAPKSPGAKAPGTAPVDVKTFLIGPEDVLGIYAYGQKDFALPSYLVRPDGMITVPLAGEVLAAGKTPEQLGADISEKLTQFIRDPQIIVTVQAVHSKKYRIQGEVNKPGEFDLVRPTTVLEALVNAGGFRDFANTKNIRVLRDGGKKILKFNYNDVSNGKHLEQNVLLEPNDIIIVK